MMQEAQKSKKSDAPKKTQKIWVAKEVSLDSVSISQSVPMSIFKKAMGIPDQHAKHDSQHTILGEWEDFQEFEKLYKNEEVEHALEEEVVHVAKQDVIPPPRVNVEEEAVRKEKEKQAQFRDHISLFQQYREIREEHALHNWQRHSLDWHKTEMKISKKTGKSPENLLMARLGEYRRIVENRQLIEEALLLLEQQNINFWKEGLKIGNDLLGLNFKIPKGGPRQVERLHFKEKKRIDNKKILWLEQEDRSKEYGLALKSIDPFYRHDGEYIEAIGKSLSSLEEELAKAYLDRLEKLKRLQLDTPENSFVVENYAPEESHESMLTPGMHLLSSTKRLVFEVPLNQISTSVVTIHNIGTVAIYFEWVKEKKSNPLNTRASQDGVQRFFLNYRQGVILPGTAFDFPIVFKSTKNGIFTENWSFVSSPELPNDQKLTITLQGVAVENDSLAQKRASVDKLLHSRCARHIAKEVMSIVLERVESSQPKYTLAFQDHYKAQFEEKNKSLKLFYNPIVYSKISKLSTSVYESIQNSKTVWNGSILGLYESIMSVASSEQQTIFISLLNQYVNESTIDSDFSHTIMTVICNETLVLLSAKIVDVSDDLRKKLNLSPKTPNFNDTENAQEDTDIEALKAVQDGKKGAVDSKKGAPAANQPKKAAAPPPKQPEVGKKVAAKKPNELADEEFNLAPKPKKKPLSSQGWSAERKQLEKKYSAALFETVRTMVVNHVDKMISFFA